MKRVWLDSYTEGTPHDIDPDTYPSLVALIDEAIARFPDRAAFDSMGVRITFADLDRLARDFAGFLVNGAGLAKGDRIALMMPNVLQYPVALIAALRAGLVVVNTNPLYTARELRHQLVDSGARAIVVLENFGHVLGGVHRRHRGEARRRDRTRRHAGLSQVGAGEPRGAPRQEARPPVPDRRREPLEGRTRLGQRRRGRRGGGRRRRSRLPPVHRRHHRGLEGRDAHPSEHGGEHPPGRRVPAPIRPRGGGGDHHRAAALSHLRADRELPDIHAVRRDERADHQSARHAGVRQDPQGCSGQRHHPSSPG